MVLTSDFGEDYTATVFNFELDDFHTYFIGKNGIWVHNQNCPDSVNALQKGIKPVNMANGLAK